MFTGLIRETAPLHSFEQISDNLWKIQCLSSLVEAKDWTIGASIALNGICLTLTESESIAGDRQRLAFEVSAETMNRSNLGRTRLHHGLHLEPSLKVGDSLGGHWVLGHVDGCGRVSRLSKNGECLEMDISLSGADRERIAPYIVSKGSIAVDGVSLTVNHFSEDADVTTFSLMLIPHTLKLTRFASLSLGDLVNLEADVLAKFSARDRVFQQNLGRTS